MKVKRAKELLSLWHGQVDLMGRWLDEHDLPYRKGDVVIIPKDEEADLLGYEFILDPKGLEIEAVGELKPEVLKTGTIKVTFYV